MARKPTSRAVRLVVLYWTWDLQAAAVVLSLLRTMYAKCYVSSAPMRAQTVFDVVKVCKARTMWRRMPPAWPLW